MFISRLLTSTLFSISVSLMTTTTTTTAQQPQAPAASVASQPQASPQSQQNIVAEPQQQQQQQQSKQQQPQSAAEELQQSLHKFLYQLHNSAQQQHNELQQSTQNNLVAPLSPLQQHPLVLPAAATIVSASAKHRNPLAALGPPSLFPSGLLVPTPAHLPATFRLPATVMSQHKAFPMEGAPPHPPTMLTFSSIVEQPKGGHRSAIGGGGQNGTTSADVATSTANGAEELKTGQLDVLAANTVSAADQPASTTESRNENTVPKQSGADTVSKPSEGPPVAVPVTVTAANESMAVPRSKEDTVAATIVATVNQTTVVNNGNVTVLEEQQYGSKQQQQMQQHILLVPAALSENGTTKDATATAAVDLEAFLHSANMSTRDTKQFLGLVERLLEREVARRLQKTLLQKNGTNAPQQQQSVQAQQLQQENIVITNPSNISVKTDGHQIVLELPATRAAAAGSGDMRQQQRVNQLELERDLEERQRYSQKELKTANTRLFSLASGEETAPPPPPPPPPQADQRDGAGVLRQHQQGVINLDLLRNKASATAVASAGTALAPNKALSKSSAEDYKQREQAEFDRLLDQLRAEEGGAGGSGGGERVDGTAVPAPAGTKTGTAVGAEDADLLLIVPPRRLPAVPAPQSPASVPQQPASAASVQQSPASAQQSPASGSLSAAVTTTMASSTASTPKAPAASANAGVDAQQQQGGMMMNRQHQFWSRHGPKTKFERLVEDYRWRLTGQDSQNGLNDLIKALRNANIGFFDALANPAALKILRRID